MMVIFVSQCEKNALKKTRRVLDAFANRIGDNTWQTIITEDGLQTVKKMLRQTASKSTAVSCHWLRGRSRCELVWVVGNRLKFNAQGEVPVNRTQKKQNVADWENQWIYLPAIKAITAMAALLHDWGKASVLFQKKLKSSERLGDPLRHEWMSCLLLHALVHESGDIQSDEAWLGQLGEAVWEEEKLIARVQANIAKPLADLPPIAQLVAWLVVSHHRLPALQDKNKRKSYVDEEQNSITSTLSSIDASWGYSHASDDKRTQQCFQFPHGLLSNSKPWLKSLRRWASRLNEARPLWQTLLENGAWRVALHHARLSLMLGDHYYSSCDEDHHQPDERKKWRTDIALYANTKKEQGKSVYKQFLDQHLVRVSDQGLLVCQSLSRFGSDMEQADAPPGIKKKSPANFAWQDQAAQKIKSFRAQQDKKDAQQGWFVVNMASTGCGKTIANAKIMRALAPDGERLRFILALGLRTLTLQTGDVYRQHIGLDNSELAVLIGSRAVQTLHQESTAAQTQAPSVFEEEGSESQELLLSDYLDYDESPTAEFLDVLFPSNKAAQAKKSKAFLYKPVLVCTIDHLMAATETKRGGRYILPCLRLLSSDLVIDEIDDFNEKDLIAIGRLIHLAGMLGRKVMISSATIPPALAEGFFHAYQKGWQLHQAFMQAPGTIACAWVDEFNTEIEPSAGAQSTESALAYQAQHQKFIKKRLAKLAKQPVKRRAHMLGCADLYQRKGSGAQQESLEQSYFQRIQESAIALHQQHHIVDAKTGKKVSFGVVRMANIPPCIGLAEYLLQAEWPAAIAPKIMAYHSRQVLLLRHEQERHLDAVLQRKLPQEDDLYHLNNAHIRRHLDTCTADNMMFVVAATPVEEIGRDHCLDWAIIEPSSYRSIIQMAGRVLRHRFYEVLTPNIAILQYNLKALRNGVGKPAFVRPGYENFNSLKLAHHDLGQLVDLDQIAKRLDASVRIQEAPILDPKNKLADLEHQAMNNVLCAYDKKGAGHLEGWLSGYWWLTALPQQINAFRESHPEITLYRCWDHGNIGFYEKNDLGEMVSRNLIRNIVDKKYSEDVQARLWLKRDYETVLRKRCGFASDAYLSERDHIQMRKESERYGEINMPDDGSDAPKPSVYSDDFGLVQKK